MSDLLSITQCGRLDPLPISEPVRSNTELARFSGQSFIQSFQLAVRCTLPLLPF